MKAETAAKKTANESLALLNVEGHLLPTVSRYPKSYNRKALKFWIKALEKTQSSEDTHDTWLRTIRCFLKLCKDAGVEAFDQARTDAINDGVEAWLKSNRVKAIKFCNDTELFKFFKIASARRSATITGQEGRNFYVQNIARLKATEDPTLERWLLGNPMPGFTQSGGKTYTKNLNAASSITINFIGTSAATVTLTIYCHSLPMASGKKTNKALAKYIEVNIWTPLVRKFTFNGVNKLF